MKKLAGFLGAVGMLAVAPLAHANYSISYQIGAGAIVQCANSSDDTTASCSNVSSGGVTIQGLSGNSNSPGGAPPTKQTSRVPLTR